MDMPILYFSQIFQNTLYIKLILGCEGGVSEICLHRPDTASIGSLSENQIDDRHAAKVHRNAHLVFNTIAPSLIHCESGYKDHVLPTNIYRPQRSWAKVIFSQASVCPQGGGEGCLPQCMLGYTPRDQTPPRADPTREQTPPRDQTPLGADTLPPGSRLQHKVNERPVRILLECILVLYRVTKYVSLEIDCKI